MKPAIKLSPMVEITHLGILAMESLLTNQGFKD